MLQAEEQSLREACREHDKKMSQQEKAMQDLQQEKGISNQQVRDKAFHNMESKNPHQMLVSTYYL